MDTDETRIGGLEAHMHPDQLLHREVTEAAVGAAYEVHNTLGYGCLGKVCQRALQADLIRAGRRANIERSLRVKYRGVAVGEYFADLIVEDLVLGELKVAPELNPFDEAPLRLRVGLLINSGRTKLQFLRRVF